MKRFEFSVGTHSEEKVLKTKNIIRIEKSKGKLNSLNRLEHLKNLAFPENYCNLE